MPAYKYKTTKGAEKWYCAFYVKTFSGENKKVKKSGFDRKKDAQEYEREYLTKFGGSPEITFKALCELYMEDVLVRRKQLTIRNKRSIIQREILPVFADIPAKDVTPDMVRLWQNDLMKKGFKPTTLATMHAILSGIFNWAVKYRGLKSNPAKLAGTIGKSKADEMNIISVEDFKKYLESEQMEYYRVFFSVLFWTGMRRGECVALTWDDIDFEKSTIRISKTYIKLHGVEYIGEPKTPRSNRVIAIHSELLEMLKEYKEKHYKPKNTDRIFSKSQSVYTTRLTGALKRLGLPHMRVHDLRHSHASMLLSAGVDVVSVSRRLGHENTTTTLDTYAHLMPNSDAAVIEKLSSTFLVPK